MKRSLALLLALLLCALLLAGCGGDPEVPSEPGDDNPLSGLTEYTTEEYMENPDLFVPQWASEFTSPEWMHDWEEKLASFADPNGRLMVCAHRAEHLYNPEDSIEGILSAIAMGVDMVELDVHKTKDGVMILMHDDTVTRKTNVETLRADGVALPATDNISDWTYEELMQLNLTNGFGLVTKAHIPTLEQAVQVCKGKIFITLDKIGWSDEIKDIIVRNNAFKTVLIPYSTAAKVAKEIQDEMLAQYGDYPLMMVNGHKGGLLDKTVSSTAMMMIDRLGLLPIIRGGEFTDKSPEEFADLFAETKGKYRIYHETLDSKNDTEEVWKMVEESGASILINNHTLALCKYVAANYNG